jgi:hypothetical protein
MARIHRLERYRPEPGATAPKIIDGPHVIEIERDRIVADPTGPEGQRIETEIVSFTLAEDISSFLLLEMGAVIGGDNVTDQNFAPLVWHILNEALPAGELARFRRWATQANPKVDIPELVSYISQMVAALTERPTTGQSGSQPGLPDAPTTSTGHGEPTPVTLAAGSAL